MTELFRVAATDLKLYSARDATWIAAIVDEVAAVVGQPWRVLRERLEHTQIPPKRVAAITAALRRVMGGRADRAKIARKVRSLVLGHPVLDNSTRTARLVFAEAELGIPADELESLLWVDLADERPVTLPDGRPDELRLAAFANLDRIQRTFRRARRIRIHVWGDAHELVRAAARFGLMATITMRDDVATANPALRSQLRPARITTLDVLGPLSLFHSTGVYGRALGALVPYLHAHARFLVEVEAEFGFGPAAMRVTSPALLPPPSPSRTPRIDDRIASALEKAGAIVEREIEALQRDEYAVFPDLAVTVPVRGVTVRGAGPATTRWVVELVGFATREFLEHKLLTYDRLGITRVVLLAFGSADAKENTDDEPEPHGDRRVVRYRARTVARDILAIISG